MTDGGKGGNPKAGFPSFPPSLEIACAIPTFPHALRLLIYNHWGTQTGLLNLSPMSVDRSVTYVPGRTRDRHASGTSLLKPPSSAHRFPHSQIGSYGPSVTNGEARRD